MKTLSKLALLALVVAFTSCKKNWTCTCQIKTGGELNAVMAEKMKKKDAKAVCEQGDDSPTSPYSNCHVK